MQNRAALIEMRNPEERFEIYNLAYRNFAFLGQASSELYVSDPKVDLFSFSHGTQIVNYFVAMYAAQDAGKLEEFLQLGLLEAISRYYDPSLLDDVSVEIHSPGKIGLFTRTIALTAYVGLMLTVSEAGIGIQEARATEIHNSVKMDDDTCLLDVTQKFRDALNKMHADTWAEICRARMQSKDSIGLETPLKIENQQAATKVTATDGKEN